ncbi:hypothetical protein HAX54_006319, partial [Datura stramonium]|nr:hypothetical protein [Datura stramonium]
LTKFPKFNVSQTKGLMNTLRCSHNESYHDPYSRSLVSRMYTMTLDHNSVAPYNESYLDLYAQDPTTSGLSRALQRHVTTFNLFHESATRLGNRPAQHDSSYDPYHGTTTVQ